MIALPPTQRRILLLSLIGRPPRPPKWYGLVNAVLAGACAVAAIYAASSGEWFGCAACLLMSVVSLAIAIHVQRKVW
jgi:hypothetical protein